MRRKENCHESLDRSTVSFLHFQVGKVCSPSLSAAVLWNPKHEESQRGMSRSSFFHPQNFWNLPLGMGSLQRGICKQFITRYYFQSGSCCDGNIGASDLHQPYNFPIRFSPWSRVSKWRICGLPTKFNEQFKTLNSQITFLVYHDRR